MKRRLLPFLIAASLLLPAGDVLFAEGLPDLGEAAQGDFSPLLEQKIGASIINDIRAREPSYLDDAEVTGYLNRLGGKLAAQSEGGAQSFEFFALKDPTLNAFAMPGGYIGVHTGLILASQSESELASVLAHEISHVTQRHLARLINKSGQGQAATLLSLAVAILAARSNPDVAVGAAMAGQAAGIQNQLNYSRDFEREADRIGLQVLERSGFDIRGMGSFFDRLQKFGRLYENNAPGYLRTHPLTTERISDMGNRIQGRPYKQVADSTEFLLVKAKLRAQQGTPHEAVHDFQIQLNERKFASEAAVRYGMAQARLRFGDIPGAERELSEVRRLKLVSPMVETLAAELRAKQNDFPAAIKLLSAAHARYPQDRAISYAYVSALQDGGEPAQALRVVSDELTSYPSDARMHTLQAKSYALLGQRTEQHRAQAEAYVLQGQLAGAIIQLELAQKANDGNFYVQSQVDARLRELKKQQIEELKQKKP
jgi:predicted Zn-dependent protease